MNFDHDLFSSLLRAHMGVHDLEPVLTCGLIWTPGSRSLYLLASYLYCDLCPTSKIMYPLQPLPAKEADDLSLAVIIDRCGIPPTGLTPLHGDEHTPATGKEVQVRTQERAHDGIQDLPQNL